MNIYTSTTCVNIHDTLIWSRIARTCCSQPNWPQCSYSVTRHQLADIEPSDITGLYVIRWQSDIVCFVCFSLPLPSDAATTCVDLQRKCRIRTSYAHAPSHSHVTSNVSLRLREPDWLCLSSTTASHQHWSPTITDHQLHFPTNHALIWQPLTGALHAGDRRSSSPYSSVLIVKLMDELPLCRPSDSSN